MSHRQGVDMWRGEKRRWVKLLLVLPGLSGCLLEGDVRVDADTRVEDPCVNLGEDLADGIRTGDDVRAVFDCLNRSGDFDPLVPLMDAAQYGVISDGATSVLDMWLYVLEQKKAASQNEEAVSVSDLTAVLDTALEVLDDPSLEDAILLTGEVLASGTVDALVPLGGGVSEVLSDLRDTGAYDPYLKELTAFLCPDLETKEQCVGDVQQLYRGFLEMVSAYGTSQYVLPSGEDLAGSLSRLFAPLGSNTSANRDLNMALGRGLARLGSSDFLTHTLGTYVPVLYGDDTMTPVMEGYESFDANKSALYALTSRLADPEFRSTLAATLNGVMPLVTQYYVFSATSLTGKSQPAGQGSCSSSLDSEASFEEQNPAHFGVDQLLRLVKSLDVDVNDYPTCQELLVRLLGTLGTQAELSDTSNLATLLLEVFSQLPFDTVQSAIDAGSVNSDMLDVFNSACGTTILPDDYEALQGAFHLDPSVESVLQLLAAIHHASTPGDVGTMETLKTLVVELYDTHMLCEVQPWLATIWTGEASLEGLEPFLPPLPGEEDGQPYHTSVTVPLLRVVNGLQGARAETLAPPLAALLEQNTRNVADLLTGLGALGYNAEAAHDAGEAPAFYRINTLLAELPSGDPNAEAIARLARAIDDRLVLEALLSTLAVDEIQDAFDATYPAVGGRTVTEFLFDAIDRGYLEGLMDMAHSILIGIDAELNETRSDSSKG